MLAVNLSANSLAQRTKVVKTKTCRQLVINGDITLLAQFLDADLEYRRLAGQMCRLVIIRKIDSDVTCLAGLCLLYTSPSPRDATLSRMPSSA